MNLQLSAKVIVLFVLTVDCLIILVGKRIYGLTQQNEIGERH